MHFNRVVDQLCFEVVTPQSSRSTVTEIATATTVIPVRRPVGCLDLIHESFPHCLGLYYRYAARCEHKASPPPRRSQRATLPAAPKHLVLVLYHQLYCYLHLHHCYRPNIIFSMVRRSPISLSIMKRSKHIRKDHVVLASFSLLVLWVHSPFQLLGSLSFEGKSCSCGRMEFPRRSESEEAKFRSAWQRSVQFVIAHKLTFMDEDLLKFHRDVLHEIESKGIPGMIFECGVAKAGSSITFAAYKHPKRCLHLFDTFEGIPEPSSKDGPDVLQRYMEIKADKLNCQKGLPNCNKEYYGNMDNLLLYDKTQFEMAGLPASKNAVYFHKGLFDDTVWPAGPIAYAHLVSNFLARVQGCFRIQFVVGLLLQFIEVPHSLTLLQN